MLQASRNLNCGNFETAHLDVALVSIQLACSAAPVIRGIQQRSDNLPYTCLEAYAADNGDDGLVPAWECSRVIRLGCCYKIVLRYAELLYSPLIRDRIAFTAGHGDGNDWCGFVVVVVVVDDVPVRAPLSRLVPSHTQQPLR